MRRVIGVADMALSDSPEELLVTYSLGSCIAVIIFDPRAYVGGMLHYMLPESSLDPEKAELTHVCLRIRGSVIFLRPAT